MSASGTPAAALMRTHSGRQPSLAPPASPQAFNSTTQVALDIELPLLLAHEYGIQLISARAQDAVLITGLPCCALLQLSRSYGGNLHLLFPLLAHLTRSRSAPCKGGFGIKVHTCRPPVLLLRKLESTFQCSPSPQPLLIAQSSCCLPLLPCAAPHSP